MPQPVQARTPHSLAILPITLTTSLSLIATLIYLQLLYATSSFLLRLIQSPHRDPAPLRDTINQAERRTVDILFRIVPVPLYRSPPTSGLLHEDPLGHRIVSAARSGQPVSHFRSRSHVSNASSETAIPDELLQCYPSNAVERMGPAVQYTPAPDKLGQTNNENASNTSITYEAIKPAPQKSRPRILAMMDQQTTSTQQVTQADSTKHNQASEETQVPETGDTQSSEPVPDMPDTVNPAEEEPPKASLDETSACGMCTISPESSDSFSLPLSRTPKRRSVESYPGRYPVSDRVNLTDLATAPYAFREFRERGTILVRPFSDY